MGIAQQPLGDTHCSGRLFLQPDMHYAKLDFDASFFLLILSTPSSQLVHNFDR
jgi:hypothetical protein